MISLWNISMPSLDVPDSLKFRILDLKIYATPFFWGPFLYLYVLHMTGQQNHNKKKDLLHLTVPVAVTLSQVFIEERSVIPSLPAFLLNAFYIHAGCYAAFAYRRVLSHQKRVQNTFSQIDRIHLNWLKRLLAIFAITLLIDFLVAQAITYRLVEYGPALGLIVLLESATIFAIGYFSLQQPQILFPEKPSDKDPKKKYDNSALDDPLSKQLAEQLETLMKTVQPYKRNDLKLADLADLMDLSNHHLSQVINEQMGCNFYEFVNQYRIEYAAGLMRNCDQINITRLAFDAGFNNRVSFTNAFKKQTGLTPSAYLKNNTFKRAS